MYEQTTIVTSAPIANKDVTQTRSPPMARIALLMVAEMLTTAIAKKIVERILMTISLVFLVIYEHSQFILTGEIANGFSRAGSFYNR